MTFQTVFGTGLLALALNMVLRSFGVMGEPQELFIEVHSLEYSVEDGVAYITQDRTVGSTGESLTGSWEAKVYTIIDGNLTEVCSGGSGSDYTVGRLAHRMTFDYWVGQDGCYASLPDQSMVRLYALHGWGAGAKKAKWSERFIVDKAISK